MYIPYSYPINTIAFSLFPEWCNHQDNQWEGVCTIPGRKSAPIRGHFCGPPLPAPSQPWAIIYAATHIHRLSDPEEFI